MSHPFLPQLPHDWWSPEECFRRFGLPDSLRLQGALCCTDSLTRHLEQQTGQTVSIRLESQLPVLDGQAESCLWDRQHALPPDSVILARSAWLVLGEREWVYAHSQVAVDRLPVAARAAVERGAEPLGSVFLEREGRVERTDLELTRAVVPELARHLGDGAAQTYWCRRSLFRVDQAIRARIFEIFLPDLLS
ncbi:MAG: chorismate pyruvate-lyase family protein [Magnetococcus sp. DMHC-8]